MKRILTTLLFFTYYSGFNQNQAYQDQITLKNDSVYIGLIIEQTPGKEIKLYRFIQNDTLSFPMLDILKLNKIYDPKNGKRNNKKEKP